MIGKSFFAALIICFYLHGMTPVYTEEVTIHGFISQGYIKTSHNDFLAETEDGTFEFNEMGINFTSVISGQLRIGLQLFARDLGDIGNDKLTIDWAFADYKFFEPFGIRVGKMKMTFNLYNDTRDADFTYLPALLPQSGYAETFRDAIQSLKGVGVYGNTSFPKLGSLSYILQYGILDFDTDSGLVATFQNVVNRLFGMNFIVDEVLNDTSLNGRLCWQFPTDSLKFVDFFNLGYGVWRTYGWNIIGHIEENGTAFVYSNESIFNQAYSLEYAYKGWYIVYEYQQVETEDRFDITEIKTNTDVEGWYLLGSYRFSDTFELGIGYSEFFPDAHDKRGKKLTRQGRPDFLNWLYDTSFTLRIDLNENWITKLEYHYMDGFGSLNSVKNEESELDRYWHLFVIKISYLF